MDTRSIQTDTLARGNFYYILREKSVLKYRFQKQMLVNIYFVRVKCFNQNTKMVLQPERIKTQAGTVARVGRESRYRAAIARPGAQLRP